jgi:AraC-like DNA-binding protein
LGQQVPLSAFPLISTNQIEEAELQLSRTLTDLEILSAADRKQFHLRMNGVNFQRVSLVYNRFESDTQIRSRTPGDSVLFIVGNGTPATFIMDGEAITVSPHQAAVVSPHDLVKVNRPKGSEVLVVRVSMAVLNNYFQHITSQYHKSPLVFAPGLDLKNGKGMCFRETLKFIINEIGNNELQEKSIALHDMFDHMLMTSILNLPHNLSKKVSPDISSYEVPAIVRLAEEYIEAHLTDPISIAGLLTICKCSRSTLFSAFQTIRGYTPMEFLIERRLQRARRKLLERNGFDSVSLIALDSGFTHLSRFSQTYKKRFGETPLATIRKKH